MNEPSFPDLRTFLDHLRADGDLAVVDAEVDPYLEIAEIHRRVIAAEGPALKFNNVKGSRFPLVTNLFGSSSRATLAFGRRPQRLIERVVELVGEALPPGLGDLWAARDLALEAIRIGTKRRRRGPVLDVNDGETTLNDLPAITSWPEDGGPFVTLPLVYTEHPDGLGSNLGMYRMQIHGPWTTGMHWQIGKGGGFHYAVAEEKEQALPVSVFLGGPPAATLAAVAPLPENVPELVLASLIAGHKISQCSGTGPLPLLAEAEFAISGYIQPGDRLPEGPFGDHYGYYSLQHDYPVFSVGSITHRSDAIYPATVVGKPRQEDFFIGDLLQELLSPLFPLVMPAVEKIWSYGETGYHSLAAAVVKQRYGREAMASAFRILGEGQLSLTKFLLVTDCSVDLCDFRLTLEHILARTKSEADLYVFSNLSMDTLDYTGPKVNSGSKGVWIGTGEPVRELPREFAASELPSQVRDPHVFCGGCVVIGGVAHSEDPELAQHVAEHAAFAEWPLVILTDDPAQATSSATRFLWSTFTRFEPAADIYSASQRIVRNRLVLGAPIVIDARMKESYPDELFCDEATAVKVTRRWTEYFPSRNVEMGDSDSAHLGVE
ncbi:MAG: UbiD family decarboxylase [bacterium]|nr:UbiD family decarboxylase [bacterium]